MKFLVMVLTFLCIAAPITASCDTPEWRIIVRETTETVRIWDGCEIIAERNNYVVEIGQPPAPSLDFLTGECTAAEAEPVSDIFDTDRVLPLMTVTLSAGSGPTEYLGCREMTRFYDSDEGIAIISIDCVPLVFQNGFEKQ